MYLTRLRLDPENRNTMRAMANPNQFHGAVETAFPGERRRSLWRIDTLQGQPCLLILSEERPDLTRAAAQFCRPGTEWETLPYEKLLDRVKEGGRWHFRLTANPTVRRDGKILAHTTTAYQQQWLLERAENCGFSLAEDEFLVTGNRWYQFYKKKGDPHKVSLLAVTYEGTLTVRDAERFKQTLCAGIGREKAYGMGLLTIVGV